jgi:hypothetical protein
VVRIVPLARKSYCRRIKAWLDANDPDSDLWRSISLTWGDACQ